MSNVEQKKSESKSGQMVAPPRAGAELTEQQKKNAAIQAMAGRGFSENLKRATVIQEPELEKNKDKLIGVPFIILSVDENDGDYGPFVSVTCQLESDEVIVFNDGSTGVMAQLEGMHDKCPIFVASGLRVSEYVNQHTNTKSRTFYLSGQGAKRRIAQNGQQALHSNV